MGNVGSVANALDEIGCEYVISNKIEQITKSGKIILPGVGAFAHGMNNLRKLGLVDILNQEVLVKKKPILGICLGMQLFAARSFENGEHIGLGWIEGDVKRILPDDNTLKIPHVGWNDVVIANDSRLFQKIRNNSPFYFVHSYYLDADEKFVTSVFNYGGKFTASIGKNNIYGVQFHPEKSAESGLALLRNFVEVC
jgi:glutamine amidotransferase